jgi:hypothetical protein
VSAGAAGMGLTDAWVFLLPAGWARFPIGDGREAELDEAVEQVVRRALPDDLPRDRAEPMRRMIRERLRAQLVEADGAGASVVYLPVRPIDGVVVPASIVEVEFESDAGVDPLQVVSSVLADGYEQSEVLALDGRAAARVVATRRQVEREGDWPTVSTRQIVYVVSRDEEAGEWLALSCSIVFDSPESERLAGALELFFDAAMTTFRWVGGDADVAADRPSVPGSARGG